MANRKHTTPAQERAIERLFIERFSASQIYRELERDGLLKYPNPAITKRTIQERVRQLKREVNPPDPSGPWTLADADPEEARLVLDVVATVFESTVGRGWLTKALAARIARVRRAVPDIPPMWAYDIARAYQICAANERDSRYLDFALGARPWTSAERAAWLARLLGKPLPDESLGMHVDSMMVLLALMTYKGSLEDIQARFPDYSRDPIPAPRSSVASRDPRPLPRLLAGPHGDGTGATPRLAAAPSRRRMPKQINRRQRSRARRAGSTTPITTPIAQDDDGRP